MIGVVNTNGFQGIPLRQYDDAQKQLCHQQWYFIPVRNEENEQIYIIQSVHNRKVFDVPGGHPSHDAKIQQWTIATLNSNQHFWLKPIGNENLCQIQSVASRKVLDATTTEFVTQGDLEILPMNLTAGGSTIAWQLLPFNKGKIGFVGDIEFAVIHALSNKSELGLFTNNSVLIFQQIIFQLTFSKDK